VNELFRNLLFLPEQRSSVAREIDSLHYFVIGVTMAGTVAVALVVFYFLVRYREGAGAAASAKPPVDDEPGVIRRDIRRGIPLWLEGAIVIALLGLFLMWWVMGFRQFVHLRTAPPDSIEVYVTAKKWMWSFAYPDGDVSNTVLYVPVRRPVKLVMTSRDVIHSFFVPEFRLKQDVVPGRMTTMWFEATDPGIYHILCAEYCGTSHSTMRGRVVALPEAEYRAYLEALPAPESPLVDPAGWAAGARAASDLGENSYTLARMGERVAGRYGCLRCHTVDGAPHIGPTFARAYGSEVVLEGGATVIADEAYLTESMMDPLARLHRGFEPVMPSYQGLLTAGETGALVEYIRSLRDVRPDALSPMPQLAPGDQELRIRLTPERMSGRTSEPAPERAPGAEDAPGPAPAGGVPWPTEPPELSPAVEETP
jgi:cytochrome c oxidase subunit 2